MGLNLILRPSVDLAPPSFVFNGSSHGGRNLAFGGKDPVEVWPG